MRILFSFIGGLGHFYPMEPLARAAVRSGHDVAVAGSGTLTARIADAGFEALATSPQRPDPTKGPTARRPLAAVDARAAEIEFAENFAGKGARRHARALPEHLSGWRPDVVVRDEADLGAAIAAGVHGVPCATVLVLGAGTLIRPDLVAGPLAKLRAESGLPPDPELTMVLGETVLAPMPPSFRDPAGPFPLPDRTLWFRPRDPVTRPGRQTTRPNVYATLGTVFNTESGDLLEHLLAGLAQVDADVLVTVGRDLDPASFGPQPAHVRVERFVPQDDVLGRADLVVSHGGSGSLMAALAHGVPSVLLPLGADQPHNADRAAELGVARVLDAATASAEVIRDAVASALNDSALTEAALGVAAETNALPGVDEAIRELVRLGRG